MGAAASDGELIRRVLGGDTGSFSGLVERYQDAVFGVALSKTGRIADAEDIAQESFLAAFESLRRLDRPARFGSWLYGITRNKVKMHLRGVRLREKAHEAWRPGPPVAAPADDRVCREETRAAVLDALERLPDPSREAATLYYINGYSQEDISRFTSRPLGTIKRHLHDARERLRKELVTMVEGELKRSRPGREFRERILRKVSQVRVWLRPEKAGPTTLLVTDSKRRSFPILIGSFEGEAIRPWLNGEGSRNALDLHTAVIRALDRFGCRIKEVTITELRENTFYASLTLRSAGRAVEVDCRPSDALNFAVRAGAPISVSKDLVDQCVMRGRRGKPLSPGVAWRGVRHANPMTSPNYPDIAPALRAIEAAPEAQWPGKQGEALPEGIVARMALCELAPGFTRIPPMLRKTCGGLKALAAWAHEHRGTALEGVGLGLLGAVYLWPPRQRPQKAIPRLEAAHHLRPSDRRIAFDLATAYAMAGRADDAFAIMRKLKLEGAANCVNFISLWPDPRFARLAGKPDPKRSVLFFSKQLECSTSLRRPVEKRKCRGARILGGPLGMPKGIRLRRPARELTREVETLLGCGKLLAVGSVARPRHPDPSKQWLVLGIEGKGAALRLREQHRALVDRPLQAPPPQRPMTCAVARSLLGAAGLNLDAVLLVKQGRAGIEAALVLRGGAHREAISLLAPGALAVSFDAKSPLLIAQSLAEKLYLRDKSGKPVSVHTAARQLGAH